MVARKFSESLLVIHAHNCTPSSIIKLIFFASEPPALKSTPSSAFWRLTRLTKFETHSFGRCKITARLIPASRTNRIFASWGGLKFVKTAENELPYKFESSLYSVPKVSKILNFFKLDMLLMDTTQIRQTHLERFFQNEMSLWTLETTKYNLNWLNSRQ